GPIPLESIPVNGIDSLDIFDVSTGRELGYVLKLLAFARRTEQGVETAVKPVFLSCEHPLTKVSGPFNAVSVYGSAVGHTMYYGRGAGGSPTASAVIADILSMALGTWPVLFPALPLWKDESNPVRLADVKNSLHRYYLRFDVEDKSGVIADIASELAKRNISMNSFVQKEYHKGSLVPIVILTHIARTQDVSGAFEAIKNLSAVSGNAVSICIIDEHTELI
ncbi:MAG: hypothetical protein B0D92_07535, partial [Spirochaeta sp. LUC14_002_19_P3]